MRPELRHAPSLVTGHLLRARKKAVGSGAQLRLAIDLDWPIARVIELIGISRHVQIYPLSSRPPPGPASPGGFALTS
jgi:hypothetical protein